ncbi:hypothetical protein AOLI_G00074940 [Acnodon oligacanthus]
MRKRKFSNFTVKYRVKAHCQMKEFSPLPYRFALRSGSPAAVCDPGSHSAHSGPGRLRMPHPQSDNPQEDRNTGGSTFLYQEQESAR